MGYDNYPVMPNKFLTPDGSITTFSGVEVAPADADRADRYRQLDVIAMKFLLPDGSIAAALAIDDSAFASEYVVITRKINGHQLNADVTLTADDIGIPNPLIYKGSLDCAASPNYPAADCGNTYFVSVAGKIGGASGVTVAAGDMVVCNADGTPAGDQATVGSYWNIFEKNVDFGNVVITGGTISGVTLNGLTIGWNAVTAFTAAPASTSTLTMTSDLTATIKVDDALAYTIGGVTYFGIVGAITSNLLTVNGAPLSGSVTTLYYGKDRTLQMQVQIPATYEDASNTDLIETDLKTKLIWDKPKAYLVKFSAYSETADGSGNGQASVQINNAEVNTTAGGATIAAAKTWYPTVVNIATAAYDINPGEELEVTCIKGTGGDATFLTMKMIFVMP